MADFQTLIQNAFVDKALSSTNNWVNVGQITGTGQYANLSLNVVNTSPTASAIVSLAISNQASLPNTDDIIESNLTLAPNGGTLSRQNIIASVDEYVYVLANSDSVAVRMSGIVQALQSMEQLDSEILSLSAQQQTDMSNINSLSSQQQTDMANIANLTSQLAQDDQTLQNEINALNASLAADNTNLQNEINALNASLTADNASLTNSINGVSASLGSVNGNLQNEINALSTSLGNNVNSLQSQINNNQIAALFSNIQAPSRGLGGTYYNNTGGPMFVMVTAGPVNGGAQGYDIHGYVDGNLVIYDDINMCNTDGNFGCGGTYGFICFMVPNGSSYSVLAYWLDGLASWYEMTNG